MDYYVYRINIHNSPFFYIGASLEPRSRYYIHKRKIKEFIKRFILIPIKEIKPTCGYSLAARHIVAEMRKLRSYKMPDPFCDLSIIAIVKNEKAACAIEKSLIRHHIDEAGCLNSSHTSTYNYRVTKKARKNNTMPKKSKYIAPNFYLYKIELTKSGHHFFGVTEDFTKISNRYHREIESLVKCMWLSSLVNSRKKNKPEIQSTASEVVTFFSTKIYKEISYKKNTGTSFSSFFEITTVNTFTTSDAAVHSLNEYLVKHSEDRLCLNKGTVSTVSFRREKPNNFLNK